MFFSLTSVVCRRAFVYAHLQNGHALYIIDSRKKKGAVFTQTEIQVGDHVVMKKPHPCGANEFEILRIGVDFKMRCCGCGHEVFVPRAKILKNIKEVKHV